MNAVDIGKRIHSMRKQKYHSREKFATALKTSEGNIKRIETGLGLPSLDLLVRISSLLSVSTDYILFGVEENSPEINAAHIQKIFLSLSVSGRVALNNIGQELLKLEQNIKEEA